MNYFTILPKINYSFSTGNYDVVDIFNRIVFKPEFYLNENYYYEETSEKVLNVEKYSYEKYGNFRFYWLLLLANNVYNPHTDWPYSQDLFYTELKKLEKKLTFYVYENAQIVKNDILYLNESQYGIIESWNPFYKQIVIQENFNLPTVNLQDYVFKIKRINKDGSYTELPNYCSTTDFKCFGYMPYLSSPDKIIDLSGRILNPFQKIVSQEITNDLLIDTCDDFDKTEFQNSLIYNIVNGNTVQNAQIKTQEFKFISEYNKKLKINVISENYINEYELKSKQLFKDRTTIANTIFRIG